MTTETAPAAPASAQDRAQALHHQIKATYSAEIFRLAYQYAEAEGASRAAAQDRDWVRFIRRLAAHFLGVEPTIICIAEAMSELEMGHFTPTKCGTPGDPHLVGVIDE